MFQVARYLSARCQQSLMLVLSCFLQAAVHLIQNGVSIILDFRYEYVVQRMTMLPVRRRLRRSELLCSASLAAMSTETGGLVLPCQATGAFWDGTTIVVRSFL